MRYAMVLLCLFACGGGTKKPVEPLPPDDDEKSNLLTGKKVDLSSCTMIKRSAQSSDVRCDEATISERIDTDLNVESVLAGTIDQLKQTYSDIVFEDVHIAIGVRDARGRRYHSKGDNAAGLFVSADVPGKGVWSAACFGNLQWSEAFCVDAITTIAELGGAGFVGAQKAPNPIVLGHELVVPDTCVMQGDVKIVCSDAELGWAIDSADSPETLREKTVMRVRSLAEAEEVTLKEDTPACRFFGKSATCDRLTIQENEETMTFVLARSSSAKNALLICTLKGGVELISPCDQALAFE